jgi:hypothetical protein
MDANSASLGSAVAADAADRLIIIRTPIMERMSLSENQFGSGRMLKANGSRGRDNLQAQMCATDGADAGN